MLALIRPDSWNFPLFLHVFGAFLLVGTVTAGVVAELASVRSVDGGRLRQVAFRSFLFGALPAYVVMRIGAEWMHSKEFGSSGTDPTWVGIGYGIADFGGIALLVALILSGFAARRSKPGLGRAAGILAAITLAAWLVAIWAMGAKPT